MRRLFLILKILGCIILLHVVVTDWLVDYGYF